MVDWVIVGAGFTGATLAERIATQRGERVLVVDRRPHIAGNAYDAPNEAGILVHRYGPHIFHTNSDQVWTYLRHFGAWRPYEHKVLAVVDGREVPLPFNLNTIDAVFPPEAARRYTELLRARYGDGARVPILRMMGDGDEALRELAGFIYEKVFRGYTLKQWGMMPEELAPSVTGRVPIVVGRDNRYFQDRHQAMPTEGFTAVFERMLDHPNITLSLGTDFKAVAGRHPSARTIYSGAIDEFFDYAFGPLPYRSVRFVEKTVEADRVQAVATINFPSDHDYTRVTEMKQLTGQTSRYSTLVYEFPEAHVPGRTEPHYPVPSEETSPIYRKYAALARERDDVLFCGRLGQYSYYNMDQAVGAALALFRRHVEGVDDASAESATA